MKLLFLDIVGVLKRGYEDVYNFNTDIVDTINKLLDRTDAYIVVTDPYRINTSISNLNILFRSNGINRPVIGKIPYISASKDKKGQEILSYLMNNFPKCESICIIDDIPDQIENLFPAWLVKTNAKFGFTEEQIPDCLNCFKRELHSYTIWRVNFHHDYDEY